MLLLRRSLLPTLGALLHLEVIGVIAPAEISRAGLLRLHGLGLSVPGLRVTLLYVSLRSVCGLCLLPLITAISVVGAIGSRRIGRRIAVGLRVVRRGEKRCSNGRS